MARSLTVAVLYLLCSVVLCTAFFEFLVSNFEFGYVRWLASNGLC
jgi:hypothetical protein